MVDWLMSGVLVPLPRADASPTARARSAGSPTSSSGPTRCGRRTGRGAASPTRCPSRRASYYYRQVYGCFFDDAHGLDSLDKVGVDNITFETDYPHSDSTWPHTPRDRPRSRWPTSTPTSIRKIVRGNAIRMLYLDARALTRRRRSAAGPSDQFWLRNWLPGDQIRNQNPGRQILVMELVARRPDP